MGGLAERRSTFRGSLFSLCVSLLLTLSLTLRSTGGVGWLLEIGCGVIGWFFD